MSKVQSKSQHKNPLKLKRATYLAKRLEELFPGEQQAPLQHSNAFTLLVAVLLSAQCRDERVNQVTPELFALADNPKQMSRLTVAQVQKIIRPCGLSATKAKNIVALSGMLVNQFAAQVPKTLEELESLPGVGRKTAQVVLTQYFGVPTFPVDTHIHRLATRWKLTNGKNVLQTEYDLRALYPEKSWANLHLRIIFYGRTHCTARGCNAKRCLLCQELEQKKLWE